jgi:hypothetical protein
MPPLIFRLSFLPCVKINNLLSFLIVERYPSVKSRLASESGISFTEFTYQLLQAHDFLHLYKAHDVSVQIGGSDQWGNICCGIDLIHREKEGSGKKEDKERAFGLTIPLLTTASGEKFGKSVGNPIWLDEGLTSVFDFYQVSNRVALCLPFSQPGVQEGLNELKYTPLLSSDDVISSSSERLMRTSNGTSFSSHSFRSKESRRSCPVIS